MKHTTHTLGIASIAVLAALVLFLATPAHANTDIGQSCWNFTGGLVDRLRLSITYADGHHLGAQTSEDMLEAHAMWRAFSYQLLGSGLVAQSYPSGAGSFGHIGLTFSNPSSSFGGNRICAAHLNLAWVDLNGTWTITCTGTGTPFTASGGLVYDFPCAGPNIGGTSPAQPPQGNPSSVQSFSVAPDNPSKPREAGDPR